MAGCRIRHISGRANALCEYQIGQQFEADRYSGKGEPDEYLDSNIDYRGLVSFTGTYPSKIGDFHLTEKKLPGRQLSKAGPKIFGTQI